MEQDNLTQKQKDYAIYLPAISGFYATYIGKQRYDQYVDPARMPAGLKDMEMLNWLNSQKSLFPYKWSLYSAGHANLDLSKHDPSEDMLRNRESGSFILGDSGGFQIGKGLWEGDWRAGSGCTKAQKKREIVLNWLDNTSDYGMILDIPSRIIHDKKSRQNTGITTIQEASDATKYNNEYFIANRKGFKNGGARFLNVLQGEHHASADEWYNEMKQYNDPNIYPENHFDGWAMGGQNMCDVHLILKRLISMKYDGLLLEGKHDWMHFLGTSRLEWAILLTSVQRAVRRHINPNFTISFDCASPFLATANGQIYHQVDLPNNKKWTYRMYPSIDDKKYALDTRSFRDVAITDYRKSFPIFEDSPISSLCQIKDICIYKDGIPKSDLELNGEEFDFKNPDHYNVIPDLNKIGKIGRTSWDSFSYALQMAHNVWTHIYAVQEANRRFDAGEYPAMMRRSKGDYAMFNDIVEDVFASPTKEASEAIIEKYSSYWLEIIGTRKVGSVGKKIFNSKPMFEKLFDVEEDEEIEEPELDINKLEELENNE